MLPRPISDTCKLPSFRVFITYASRLMPCVERDAAGPAHGAVLIGSAATRPAPVNFKKLRRSMSPPTSDSMCRVRVFLFMSNLRIFQVRQLRLQQRLDRPTLVHRAVALGDLRQRQHQVEHLSWIDRSVEDEINQLRQILADRCRTAV